MPLISVFLQFSLPWLPSWLGQSSPSLVRSMGLELIGKLQLHYTYSLSYNFVYMYTHIWLIMFISDVMCSEKICSIIPLHQIGLSKDFLFQSLELPQLLTVGRQDLNDLWPKAVVYILLVSKINSHHTLNKTLSTNGLSRWKLQPLLHRWSSWYSENRIKEHNSNISSVIYQHSVSKDHAKANISHSQIIDQDSKQVASKVREAIHIRINNPALNHNMGKMCMPEIFNNLLGADGSTSDANPLGISHHRQSHNHLTILSNRFTRAVCLAN